MTTQYILRGKTPVPCDDLIEWARWMDTRENIVKQTKIGTMFVSTVFLGLDHNFSGKGPPILFETMTFCDDEIDCQRCSTWEQAEEQHHYAVKHAEALQERAEAIVSSSLPPPPHSRER